MRRTAFAFRLAAWAAGGCVVGFMLSVSVVALKRPHLAVTRAAIAPQSLSSGHRFASDAGIMLKFIKPDRVEDFEAIVEKLKEALALSSDPERQEQAQSWRVFKAVEPATNGDAVYVFEIDPAVRGADYTVARILAEAFPAEAKSLYRRYADASSSRQHVVDLKLIAALGDGSSRR
jgi:23S rRNA G2069 N7-methylase RlmK/C1962 C5-methylase RlmI